MILIHKKKKIMKNIKFFYASKFKKKKIKHFVKKKEKKKNFNYKKYFHEFQPIGNNYFIFR